MDNSVEKQRHIATYLNLDQSDPDGEEAVALVVTRRQMRLIFQAVEHFRATKCPMAGLGEECAVLAWAEAVHTGAIERVCTGDCGEWLKTELTSDIS